MYILYEDPCFRRYPLDRADHKPSASTIRGGSQELICVSLEFGCEEWIVERDGIRPNRSTAGNGPQSFSGSVYACQPANASRTYLGLADGEIVGFYTLVVSEVAYADAPERLTQGLARLAVSAAWQGQGVAPPLPAPARRREH